MLGTGEGEGKHVKADLLVPQQQVQLVSVCPTSLAQEAYWKGQKCSSLGI